MDREWLSKIRNNTGLTHDEVASDVGISRQYYGMIESGLRNPSVDLAMKIATRLKFKWTLFFDNKGNKTLHNKNNEKEVI
ncbi:transcriptional regulator [Paenibacillus helianthi]|uniref:Transcriptional regulator n=1 Tax=Paenibacillus helianthi TaxID=1349432 RepID=A0ABX3EUJ5_9BACL|nr:helix-turn-helix transcriptional regulator [Paenibacillus helianthi]OKP91895.1 transcriptional regulator [Paenibacillus helianthi]